MSEMVEKVAAAIWRAREEELPPRIRRMEPDELDRSTGAWKHVESLARAAIGELREPSDEMIDAAHASVPGLSNAHIRSILRAALTPLT